MGPEHRAGVLLVIYLISYLALSLPAVVAGAVVVRTGSLELTAAGYGIGGILLATLAFAGAVGSSRDPARPACTGFHQNRPLRAG